MDSYEEGEMYINGEETSGYTEKDFENYRKKYIGNIFQNFNLVNSYTVYQNVELALLINGYKKREVKKKILSTLEKVDLLKYKNTKVSKLSGGQKQRVAIARALVRETPIIVADEPTGNLDSKTAENIVELLKEVAKDKLIIIVTHNYEQVEKYVTRKITMHDGRIIEDKRITKNNQEEKIKEQEEVASKKTRKQSLTFINKIILGIRNTFNIKTKFLLLLTVYLFVSIAVIGGYSSLKKQQYEESNLGYNNYFNQTSDKRIVIQKNDLSQITDEDYYKIKNLNNVDYIVENDILLDEYLAISLNQGGFVATADNISNYRGNVSEGRLPENDDEVLVVTPKDYYFLQSVDTVIGQKVKIMNTSMNMGEFTKEAQIVGIEYIEEENSYRTQTKIYLSNNTLSEFRRSMNALYATTTINFNDRILQSQSYQMQYKVIPNANVKEDEAYVPESMNYMTKRNNCINYWMDINIENLYYKDSMSAKITKTYNKKNIKSLLGIEDFDRYNGAIFVNENQYYSMYEKENYQSSVFVKDEKEVRNTIEELKNLGYKTLYVKDTIISSLGSGAVFVNTFRIIMVAVVMIILFFISYFIIKIIMKSRNIYFSTIRILGATKRNANQLLKIELITVLNIAYIITLGIIGLIKYDVIKVTYLQSMITYLKITDLIILYIVLILLSLLISARYAKQLFKKSAMNTYREEV